MRQYRKWFEDLSNDSYFTLYGNHIFGVVLKRLMKTRKRCNFTTQNKGSCYKIN